MTAWTVRFNSAAGTARSLVVRAGTEAAAIRQGQRELGKGWYPVWALAGRHA